MLQNWTLEQLYEAHAVLDMESELDRKMAKAQELANKNASQGKTAPPPEVEA